MWRSFKTQENTGEKFVDYRDQILLLIFFQCSGYLIIFQLLLHADGKEHAMAIGQHVMSGQEIAEVNKGIGINLIHYLGDGLWHMVAEV